MSKSKKKKDEVAKESVDLEDLRHTIINELPLTFSIAHLDNEEIKKINQNFSLWKHFKISFITYGMQTFQELCGNRKLKKDGRLKTLKMLKNKLPSEYKDVEDFYHFNIYRQSRASGFRVDNVFYVIDIDLKHENNPMN